MEETWKNSARREIVASGVCDEYNNLVGRARTKEAALALYKRGIDWSLENNAPSLGLLREYKDVCEANGIFIDRTFDGEELLGEQVYVFHNCRGSIKVGLNVEKKIVPMLYFANGCEMTIQSAGPKGMATRVPLYVFGENRIMAETSEDIVCITYNKEVK